MTLPVTWVGQESTACLSSSACSSSRFDPKSSNATLAVRMRQAAALPGRLGAIPFCTAVCADYASLGFQLRVLLGLGPAGPQRMGRPAASSASGLGRFLLPLSECEFALESAVDELLVRTCSQPRA